MISGATIREAGRAGNVARVRARPGAVVSIFGGLVRRRAEGRPLPAASAMSTVTLHRVLRASPERVYRAFLDAAALSKWLPPHGFTNTVEHLDARVGGTFRMAFTQFGSGQRHAFGGTYRELVPNALLRYDDVFDDTSLPGTLLTTVRLLPLPCGTDLHVVQEGIPEQIPLHACYLGWQESLTLLALLVEAQRAE